MKSGKFSCSLRLLALAASISSAAFGAAQAKDVTVWCWDPNFNIPIMEEAARRYEAKHPDINIVVENYANGDVQQKLLASLAANFTEGLPDIVLMEDYWGQKYLQSFPGAFAALSDSVDLSGFAPYKVKAATLDGKVYAMPFDSGVAGLFYRRDYLEQAGFKPEDLKDITWDRYIEIGQQVLAKTGKKMLGIDPQDAGFLRIMMQSTGHWYYDDAGNLTIEDNAQLKATLEAYKALVNAGISKPTAGWAEWTASFNNGDVASVITGVWIVGTIKSAPDQAGKWAIAPIPKLQVEGASNASNNGGSSWYVVNGAAEQAEAIDFLNEIYAKDVDFYQTILQKYGAVGSLLAAREGPAYSTPDAFFGNDPIWQTFGSWMAKIPVVNFGSSTLEVEASINAEVPPLLAGTPVDDVLKAIKAQTDTRIQQ
ncbi:ABC transporter substrate-binding protein [Pararhizobium sp.]|uniref:ABC transporter substrate-binding protein n=1 Tax=Pararhizobium sp. TaxID=1977563 RepID=UPI0027167325|nr:extracellular solute-binding protein [Pararhizobium sp.]MDO9415063.1 extracellular solute-binding protein [Pararhizobium sp.]